MVREIGQKSELVLSVCTGSLILAKSGLLDDLKATTHHQVINSLKELAPATEVLEDVRYVDNGNVITSAGISAGIDMSLYVLERLFGNSVVMETQEYMEYKRVGS